jgi:hypothetical protein
MLGQRSISGLIDYGLVDIPKLLHVADNLSLNVVIPPIAKVEIAGEKLLQSYPKRIRLLSIAELDKYRLINNPDQSFDDFSISLLKLRYRQDFYTRVRIGGFSISLLDAAHYKTITKKRWVIVTACTRGATSYICYILRGASIAVGHDRYNREGIVSGAATPAIHLPGTILIHQVRDPIKTIRSLICSEKRLKKLCSYVELLFGWQWEDNPLFFAMRYWYEWNKLGEERAMYTYRIEALEDNWAKIKELTGIPADREIGQIAKNSNTYKNVIYPDLSWDDLYTEDSEMAQKVADLAVHFGYGID